MFFIVWTACNYKLRMGQVKRLTSHTQKTHKSINPVSKRAPRAGAQCFIAKLIHFQEISHELETCSVKTYTIPSINLLYEYILITFIISLAQVTVVAKPLQTFILPNHFVCV